MPSSIDGSPHAMPASSQHDHVHIDDGLTVPPALRAEPPPADTGGDVAASLTFRCAWGCVVRVEDTVEQPHVCVGEQLVAALAPGLTFADAVRVSAGLKGLVGQLRGDSWDDGVRSGREGLCAGVDDDVPDGTVVDFRMRPPDGR